MLATLAGTLPHARRYFLSERWGGYGQRAFIVDAVQNPLALRLLEGKYPPGTTVDVDYRDGAFTFEPAPVPATASAHG